MAIERQRSQTCRFCFFTRVLRPRGGHNVHVSRRCRGPIKSKRDRIAANAIRDRRNLASSIIVTTSLCRYPFRTLHNSCTFIYASRADIVFNACRRHETEHFGRPREVTRYVFSSRSNRTIERGEIERKSARRRETLTHGQTPIDTAESAKYRPRQNRDPHRVKKHRCVLTVFTDEHRSNPNGAESIRLENYSS